MSDGLSLGIRSARQLLLPQELPHLVQTLLIDDFRPVLIQTLSDKVSPRGRRAGCP